GLARPSGLFGADGHAIDRYVDEVLDFLGGGGALLCQAAHFAGDHGEAFAGLAGAGRFDRRVQGQDVGLEGDLFDQGNDVADLARAFVYAVHGGDHVVHDGPTTLGGLHAGIGQLAGQVGVVGVLLDGDGQLLHAGGRFL